MREINDARQEGSTQSIVKLVRSQAARAPPLLVVLCGPSHAGRSTFANRLGRHFRIVSSDEIREELATYFDRSKVEAKVWSVFEAMKCRALREGGHVVLDACHMSEQAGWHALQGPNADHRKICVVFDLPLRITLDRCLRARRVPLNEVERMWRVFQSGKPTQKELIQPGFDETYFVKEHPVQQRHDRAGPASTAYLTKGVNPQEKKAAPERLKQEEGKAVSQGRLVPMSSKQLNLLGAEASPKPLSGPNTEGVGSRRTSGQSGGIDHGGISTGCSLCRQDRNLHWVNPGNLGPVRELCKDCIPRLFESYGYREPGYRIIDEQTVEIFSQTTGWERIKVCWVRELWGNMFGNDLFPVSVFLAHEEIRAASKCDLDHSLYGITWACARFLSVKAKLPLPKPCSQSHVDRSTLPPSSSGPQVVCSAGRALIP